MKQVAQNYRSGRTHGPRRSSAGVPTQAACSCRSLYSLISTGTEVMKVKEARALARRQGAGPSRAGAPGARHGHPAGPDGRLQEGHDELDSYTPLGYSLCGVVSEVGAGAEEFAVGQTGRVRRQRARACTPRSTGSRPTSACRSPTASTRSSPRSPPWAPSPCRGQALRGPAGRDGLRHRARPRRAARGAAPRRGRRARRRSRHRRGALQAGREVRGPLPAPLPMPEGSTGRAASVAMRRGGLGADHILLVAGGISNGPVEAAARLARDRARSSTSARSGSTCPWNAYYDKELDVRFSRSYGPGRYDDRYELEGIDYPGRLCSLDRTPEPGLLRRSRGARLAQYRVPRFRHVPRRGRRVEVYDRLSSGELPRRRFPLRVPAAPTTHTDDSPTTPCDDRARPDADTAPRPPPEAPHRAPERPRSRLGFIGAGNYASSMLLPTSPATKVSNSDTSPPTGRSPPSTPSGGSDSPTMSTDAEAVLRRRHGRRRLRRDPSSLARRADMSGPRRARPFSSRSPSRSRHDELARRGRRRARNRATTA